MPRAIWSGSVSFGLVNVPVKLYTAARDRDLHFSQFAPDGSKVRYKRVSEKTGKEVDYDKIQKGYELSKGNFVILDPEELEQFDPEASRTIDIEDFVDLEEIDPIYYESTYYLAPDGDGARKAYALLLEAMEKQQRVAIGRLVMRTKQYLAAIRPYQGALALSTMRFEDEVVDRKEIEGLDGKKANVSDREVSMASQIVDSLTTKWKPAKYHDTHREKVLEYIEKKAEGEELVTPTPVAAEAKVLDLMAALEASVAAAKKGRAGAKPPVRELEKLVEAVKDEEKPAGKPNKRASKSAKSAKATKATKKRATSKRPAKKSA